MASTTRRRLLAALSAASTTALSGCSDALSDGGDDDPGAGNESDERESGPESVDEAATQYLDAIAAGEFDRAHDRVAQRVADQLNPAVLERFWIGVTAVGGEYEAVVETGQRVEEGFDVVECTARFENGDHRFDVWVGSEYDVWGLAVADEYERPDYVAPDEFEERELSIATDACDLPATATVPDAADDVPGVVLVHGSGPQDRDTSTVGTKMFADLAEGLASRGVAVLRYDKRTHRCPPDVGDRTLDAVTVDDAVTAVETLGTVDGVDEDRLVVVGHSLGGMAAPRIAERAPDLAGLVAMAAPARSLDRLVLDQQEHLFSVGERDDDDEFERVKDELERVREGDYDADEVVLGVPGALWDSVDGYDPVAAMADLDPELPLAFLQGERDFQVTVDDDLAIWRDELGDRDGITFEQYERLNHRFMPGEGPSTTSEYLLRNNVERAVVEDLAEWVSDR